LRKRRRHPLGSLRCSRVAASTGAKKHLVDIELKRQIHGVSIAAVVIFLSTVVETMKKDGSKWG
jgi:hypothetical protein